MAKYQFTTPLIVRGGEAVRLHRIPFSEKTFAESWLQELLFTHPALIPFHDLEPIFSDSIPLVRELPTAAGPLDLLYMNSMGFMTLVETKLWRSPEARRSVVAQIIDYAKEMAFWSYEDLVSAVRKAGMKSKNDPLIDLFRELEGEEFDDRRFIDSVSSNLRQGRSLLLIIGDGIQEGVEQMTSFLQQTPQLGFNLNLLEIGLYREHSADKDFLFVQPRILARTREINRATVEIKVTVQPTDIQVTIPPESDQKKTSRRPITEKEFLEQLQTLNDPRAVEFARWVLENAEAHDLTIDWGDAGPLLKYGNPIKGRYLNFGQLYRNGLLGWTYWWWYSLVENGFPLDIWRDFFDEVAKLIPNASRQKFTSRSTQRQWEQISLGNSPKSPINPPFGELASSKEQFMAAIDKAIQRIRQVLDNE